MLGVRRAAISDFHWRLSGLLSRWTPLVPTEALPGDPSLSHLGSLWILAHPLPCSLCQPHRPFTQPSRHSLSTYWVAGTVLGTWDTTVSKAKSQGASLVIQWSRLRLPTLGVQDVSLVRELRSHKPHGTASPPPPQNPRAHGVYMLARMANKKK